MNRRKVGKKGFIIYIIRRAAGVRKWFYVTSSITLDVSASKTVTSKVNEQVYFRKFSYITIYLAQYVLGIHS